MRMHTAMMEDPNQDVWNPHSRDALAEKMEIIISTTANLVASEVPSGNACMSQLLGAKRNFGMEVSCVHGIEFGHVFRRTGQTEQFQTNQ